MYLYASGMAISKLCKRQLEYRLWYQLEGKVDLTMRALRGALCSNDECSPAAMHWGMPVTPTSATDNLQANQPMSCHMVHMCFA